MITPLDGAGFPELTVTSDQGPTGLRIAVSGELDMSTIPSFLMAMGTLLASDALNPPGAVQLDLSRLEFLDVSGLNALIQAKAMTQAARCAFSLTCVRPFARHLLQLTRLADPLNLTCDALR